MKLKHDWFDVFGPDGKVFMKALINGALGTIIAILVLTFAFKLAWLHGRAMVLKDDEEAYEEFKSSRKRTVIWFVLGMVSVTAIIILINAFPKIKADINDSNYFDKFGKGKGDAQNIFHWAMTLITSVVLLIFIIRIPLLSWRLSFGEDEDYIKTKKQMRRSIIAFALLLSTTFIVVITLNVIPSNNTVIIK